MGIPVITEKKYLAIAPRLFTANGTITGVVTIATTRHFKVKQQVVLQTTTIPPSQFAIKRIISATQMVVGPISSPIEAFSNISSYTVAGGAMVYLPEQRRTSIPWEEQERATYEEEPTVARRTFLVDELGDGYRKDNPLPVQLSDGSINIGTVNAELEVFLTHLDNYPNLGEIHDSVRIGDGTEEIAVNPDGSINVKIASLFPGTPLIYVQASTITNTAETTIATFSTAVANAFIASLSGEARTFGTWRLYRNAVLPANLLATTRTSPTTRTGSLLLQQPEKLANIGNSLIVTFQAERYRTTLLGATSNTFTRLEGYYA